MSFIGQDQVPAPKLKDVTLSSEDMKKAYYQILNVRWCWFLLQFWVVFSFKGITVRTNEHLFTFQYAYVIFKIRSLKSYFAAV